MCRRSSNKPMWLPVSGKSVREGKRGPMMAGPLERVSHAECRGTHGYGFGQHHDRRRTLPQTVPERRRHRRRGSLAHLRHGLGAAGAGAARRLPAHQAQRVRGHHGPVGLGQVHADEPDRLPGYALQGQVLAERPTGERTGRRPAGPHPQQGNRIRLPDLQPAGARHFAAQCRAAAHLQRHARRGAHRAGQGSR